jgi:hypothetical protein
MADSLSEMQKAKLEMDKIIQDVMPDTWLGHGRIVIRMADLSQNQREFAFKVLHRSCEKKPNASTKKIAKLAIKHAKEKAE